MEAILQPSHPQEMTEVLDARSGQEQGCYDTDLIAQVIQACQANFGPGQCKLLKVRTDEVGMTLKAADEAIEAARNIAVSETDTEIIF
jgi:hypothetical protein